MPNITSALLTNASLLVVEDEPLIAYDIALALESCGATVSLAFSLDEAMRLLDEAPRPDGAVLDLNLSGELSTPVAERLTGCAVPFLFVTGNAGTFDFRANFPGVLVIAKPARSQAVAGALATLMRRQN